MREGVKSVKEVKEVKKVSPLSLALSPSNGGEGSMRASLVALAWLVA